VPDSMTPGSILDFIDVFDSGEQQKQLVVVNRTEPDPIQRLFQRAFGTQITVSEAYLEDAADNTVLLLDGEDVVATSSLESVMKSFLLINSDMYKTSLKGIDEYRLPTVLSKMDEEVLTLRGYPATNKEKLLLIAVSRYIEASALHADNGRLDAAFQRLSRLDDEFGTRQVYQRLSESGVSVHTYGASGKEWVRREGLQLSIHTRNTPEYRKSWFVVYTPEEGGVGEPGALLAWEVEPNQWRSTWTFDPDWVHRIQQYIVENF
jgi:hypothetical protein